MDLTLKEGERLMHMDVLDSISAEGQQRKCIENQEPEQNKQHCPGSGPVPQTRSPGYGHICSLCGSVLRGLGVE
jgi:hypothetical protein